MFSYHPSVVEIRTRDAYTLSAAPHATTYDLPLSTRDGYDGGDHGLHSKHDGMKALNTLDQMIYKHAKGKRVNEVCILSQ